MLAANCVKMDSVVFVGRRASSSGTRRQVGGKGSCRLPSLPWSSSLLPLLLSELQQLGKVVLQSPSLRKPLQQAGVSCKKIISSEFSYAATSGSERTRGSPSSAKTSKAGWFPIRGISEMQSRYPK
ncbi:unnamed protein product [Phytophthora lilii]|uniref:Unnamed protein product n=1 Tax=Phytophthora lilii TaxID=2077276 RepID=A0A9W6UDE4_9STRA|nr:unnamed protein product [Phytophthora lilii]